MENGAGPRPSAITYDRAGSAFAEADPAAIDFAGALAGARLLHTGGITPALGPKGVALARAAQAAAKAAGVPICFDGNYRGQLWSSWDSDPGAILRDLVSDASILIGNHRDLVKMMSDSMGDMAYYLVLAFTAAHFVAMFAWSNLGLILAVGVLAAGGAAQSISAWRRQRVSCRRVPPSSDIGR